jgi:hypothetical protein
MRGFANSGFASSPVVRQLLKITGEPFVFSDLRDFFASRQFVFSSVSVRDRKHV